VGGSLGLQFLAVLSPALRSLLGTAPLGLIDWLTVAGGAIVPFIINESTKSVNLEPTNKQLLPAGSTSVQ
jgi:Ca2+-transporting ATPase